MIIMAWIISIIATLVIADRKNLNVLLFFILSLFLGPVALLIAAVSAPVIREGVRSVVSSQDARTQLEGIKTSLRLIQQRVERMEAALNVDPSGTTVPVNADIVSNHASIDPPNPVSQKPKTVETRPEAFEFVLGQYWLSRIGVVLFVLGIGLFINYTFHYFSAYAKIAVGYFFAVLFLVWGEKLAKNPRFEKLSWGILGGAWGLFYLVTYAMHYVPATRIITSSTLESVLLWLVTVCAVGYNLKYRSWIVTAMTYLFGFITLSIAGMDASSVFFWAMLLVSLAYLAFVFSWNELLVIGLAGAYVMYLGILRPQLTPYGHDPVTTFPVAISLLTTAWVVFFVTILLKEWKEPTSSRISLPGLMSNSSAFVLIGLREIGYFKPGDEDFKFWFLIAIAAAHLGAALLCRSVKRPAHIVAHCALSIALASLAVVIRFEDLTVSFWWIMEMTALFVLGVHYKEAIYRCMGWLVGVGVLLRFWFVDMASNRVYAFGIEHDLLIALLGAAAFYVLGHWVHSSKVREVLREDEKNFYFLTFPIAGTIMLLSFLADESQRRWLTLHWTFLGAGLLLLGFLIKNRAFRFSALGVLVLACARIFAYDLAKADTIYKIIVVIVLGAALLGISFVYARVKQNNTSGEGS